MHAICCGPALSTLYTYTSPDLNWTAIASEASA